MKQSPASKHIIGGMMIMLYEEPNMQIFMIEDEDIICSSGDEIGGIEIGPGIIPGEGEDGSNYQ